jgi:hypothetical protein
MPKPPATGFSHPDCYASPLRDCSKNISKEHYISNVVLDILSQNGKLQVSGFPWLPKGISKWVTPAALQSHILCERHNNALSPLDTLAGRFFRAFWRINEEFADAALSKQDRLFLFNGHDIERFMLKWLCGVLVSENASTPKGKLLVKPVPQPFLRYLYGQDSLPAEWGLYCDGEVGKQWESFGGIGFAPLSDQSIIKGCLWVFAGLKFTFIIVPPSRERGGTLLEHAVYRPKDSAFTNQKSHKVVSLARGRQSSGKTISITCRSGGQP